MILGKLFLFDRLDIFYGEKIINYRLLFRFRFGLLHILTCTMSMLTIKNLELRFVCTNMKGFH